MKSKFAYVLRKREKEVTVKRNKSNAQLVNGRLEESESDNNYITNLTVLPIRSKDIEEYEGGNYTKQDRKIYARENLEAEHIIDNGDNQIVDFSLKENDIIITNDGNYEIREKADWTDFADFETFIAKKVVVE